MKPERLPGVFLPLSPRVEESFIGFFLRLSEANRYLGPSELLAVLSRHCSSPVRTIADVRRQPDALAALARMLGGDPNSLSHMATRRAGHADIIEGCQVDDDVQLTEYAQVCPVCLAESSVCDSRWDLSVVTTCAIHGVRLVDACSRCGNRIRWNRPHLLACAACGNDFRRLPRVRATDPETRLSDDFAALAPFRVRVHGAEVVWNFDMMFRTAKLIAVGEDALLEGHWPRVHFASMAADDRRRHLAPIAASFDGRAYVIDELRSRFAGWFTFVDAIPGPERRQRALAEAVIETAELTMPCAHELLWESPPQRRSRAAEIFTGRPPSLLTTEEASQFIDVEPGVLKALVREGLIAYPVAGEGFDADHLLDCREFLATGLLDVCELEAWVGVRITHEELGMCRLIEPWHVARGSDPRFRASDAVTLAKRIALAVRHLPAPDNPIPLENVAKASAWPFWTVSTAVELLLNGGLRAASWTTPHRWVDLSCDERDVSGFLRCAKANTRSPTVSGVGGSSLRLGASS
ncbi:MAG: TniQ family protein [Pseudomonadota bacterium]